jgi:hypothetical protein
MKTFLGMQVEQTARSIKIHLDHYSKEVLAGYAEYIRKAIRPKKVPKAPNVIPRPEDTPDLPDPRKQKFYRSFVAKLQFAATWVRFDITFAVSQQARSCASAGSSHWAALHHLMTYLAGTPSFKITYRRSKGRSNRDLLSGYTDADWGNSFTAINVGYTHGVQQGTNHVEVEDAEDYGSLHGRGRVLLRIYGRY